MIRVFGNGVLSTRWNRAAVLAYLFFLTALGTSSAHASDSAESAATSASSSPKQQEKHSEKHYVKRFVDPEKWAKRFDDPSRDRWQMPDKVVMALSLKPGDRVIDLGAGTGYFAIRIAKVVPKGTVIGVDIEPSMVSYMKARAEKTGLKNVSGIVADSPDDVRLNEPVDVVIVVDTYHHIASRKSYFEGVKDWLNPDGRLVIIDFNKKSPQGPPVNHRIPPEGVREELEAIGYEQSSSHDFLPYQYFLEFKVRDSRR